MSDLQTPVEQPQQGATLKISSMLNDNDNMDEPAAKRVKHEEVSASVSPVPEVLTSESIPAPITPSIKQSDDAKLQAKTDLINQSGRTIEDIIDGSDLRRFLNKALTQDIVKGLDQIVELWESGEFKNDIDTASLKKNVVLKFADILKQNAEN